jgi:hypothetical protein
VEIYAAGSDEVSGLSLADLRALMGDRRRRLRIGDGPLSAADRLKAR